MLNLINDYTKGVEKKNPTKLNATIVLHRVATYLSQSVFQAEQRAVVATELAEERTRDRESLTHSQDYDYDYFFYFLFFCHCAHAYDEKICTSV